MLWDTGFRADRNHNAILNMKKIKANLLNAQSKWSATMPWYLCHFHRYSCQCNQTVLSCSNRCCRLECFHLKTAAGAAAGAESVRHFTTAERGINNRLGLITPVQVIFSSFHSMFPSCGRIWLVEICQKNKEMFLQLGVDRLSEAGED